MFSFLLIYEAPKRKTKGFGPQENFTYLLQRNDLITTNDDQSPIPNKRAGAWKIDFQSSSCESHPSSLKIKQFEKYKKLYQIINCNMILRIEHESKATLKFI